MNERPGRSSRQPRVVDTRRLVSRPAEVDASANDNRRAATLPAVTADQACSLMLDLAGRHATLLTGCVWDAARLPYDFGMQALRIAEEMTLAQLRFASLLLTPPLTTRP